MEPKQNLGHYEIQSRLGVGGMGEVYLARDKRLDRLVAIKLLLPSFAADEHRLKRFLQEAKVTSALNHPNIGHLYEIGEVDGVYFLALEYVEGPTVGARLAAGPIPTAELLDLAVQAADALAEAHSHGVLHRDLKPDNLMIDRRGQLKVLDFGIARMESSGPVDTTRTQAMELTDPGVVMGTPRYMSPEQALGRALDARSDLFSLGVVLYQMATGSQPFHGNTAPEVTDAILHQTPMPPTQVNPRIPKELERILLRAIEKDPAMRYQTASDLRAELKRLKRDTESGQQAVAAPAPVRTKRMWAVVAGLVAVLAGVVFVATRPESAPRAREAEMVLRPILTSPTAETWPSLSPDGKTVAYSWDGEDGENADIYVKLVDAGNPLRLTTAPEVDRMPVWSPDGKYLVFERTGKGRRQILIVPALGGLERVLLDEDASGALFNYGRARLSWHPNGKQIAYSSLAGKSAGRLVLLDLESGSQKRLLDAPAEIFSDSCPVFLGDGSRLAFIRFRNTMAGSVEVLTLKDGSMRSYPIDIVLNGLATVPGREELLITPGEGGVRRLRLDTGVLELPDPLLRSVRNPSISADGKRAAYTLAIFDSNIWHVDLPTPTRASAPVRWIASTSTEDDPRYFQNGERILFTSRRSGTLMPWIADRRGRNAQMVALSDALYGSPSVSPDGQRFVFDVRAKGDAQVMVASIAGGAAQALTKDRFENIVPSWSHDGRWVYYSSNRTGRQEIWRIPPSGGTSEQVTRNGGFDSQDMPDGKYLYYSRSRSAPAVMRRGPEGTEEMLIPELGGRFWVATGKGVYFASIDRRELHYYDLATKKSAKVMSFPVRPATNGRALALSPDGRELLWAQTDSASSDIGLVENFR